MAKLTPKEQLFCREYLVDLCIKDAAIRAGFSKATAKQGGFNVFQRPRVQARIAELQAETRERLEVTVDSVVANLHQLRDEARENKQFGPAVRAEELAGKTIGAFKDVRVDETRSDAELIAQARALGTPEGEAAAKIIEASSPDSPETRH